MPTTKIKKVRKPATKAKAKTKGAAKKRATRATSRKRVKKAEMTDEPQLNVTYLTQLPTPPEPEPISVMPPAAADPVSGDQPAEPEAEDKADEVEPMVSQSAMSVLRSRLSFYLGVMTGAAVLHVLVFAVAAIVLS